MKTKAVCFPEPNAYDVVELTLPEPGPSDMVVRTLVSAISPGTERWTLRGKHMGSVFPCVPGYHRVGVVEACGSDVRGFEPGDIVYGTGNAWQETDIKSMWSAHVGHSVSPVDGYRFLYASAPNQLELDTIAFVIVVGVANRGIRFLDVRPVENVLIIGGGIIGLCAAQLCALRGAAAVLLEKDPERIRFAEGLGLSALSVDDADLDGKLTAMAPGGFDSLYDSVGHAATTDAMVQHARRQGKLLLQAQYFDKEMCALDLDQIKIRELTVKTTVSIDDQDFLDTWTNIRTRRLNVAALITHRFKAPDDLLKGYELLDKNEALNLGIVFQWG